MRTPLLPSKSHVNPIAFHETPMHSCPCWLSLHICHGSLGPLGARATMQLTGQQGTSTSGAPFLRNATECGKNGIRSWEFTMTFAKFLWLKTWVANLSFDPNGSKQLHQDPWHVASTIEKQGFHLQKSGANLKRFEHQNVHQRLTGDLAWWFGIFGVCSNGCLDFKPPSHKPWLMYFSFLFRTSSLEAGWQWKLLRLKQLHTDSFTCKSWGFTKTT